MENIKVKGAIAVTLLALGGLAGAAIGSNTGTEEPEPAAADKPEVRTEVIRRTIHRTRMAEPARGGRAQGRDVTRGAPESGGPSPVLTSSSEASGDDEDHEYEDRFASEDDHGSDDSHESDGEHDDDDD